MFISEKQGNRILNKSLYFGVMVGFIVVATIMSSGFSRDSESYNRMIEIYGVSGWSALFAELRGRELFIIITSKIFYEFKLGSIYVFVLFATISLSVKFYLIDAFSRDKFLSLAFFSSYFFILHDSTQIRFGLAVASVYWALTYLSENRRLLFSFIVVLSSIMFHVSIIVFITMLFFRTKKSLNWLVVMIFIAAVSALFDYKELVLFIVNNFVTFFEFNGSIVEKLYSYILIENTNVYLNLISRRALLVYVCVIIIFKYKRLLNDYELLCFNALLLSVLFYILLKDVEQLQIRAGAMFGFSLVFLVPYVHQYLSTYMGRGMAYIVLVSFFAAYAIKFTFYDKMLILGE